MNKDTISPMDEHCIALLNEVLMENHLPPMNELVSKLFVRDEAVLQRCREVGFEEYPPLSGCIRKAMS